MKIFISGPMRGIKDYNRPLFDECEAYLKEHGYDVFNPAWLQVGEEWTREDIMLIDLAALSRCDAICFLPNWQEAEGCEIEDAFARLNNKDSCYFDGVSVVYVWETPGQISKLSFGD